MNILVIGKAKTGTTVISKNIADSLDGNVEYHVEPKTAKFFVNHRVQSRHCVVKLIFEHWTDRPRLRAAIVHDELPLKFDRVVLIVRDPRDELISRLLYLAFPLAQSPSTSSERLERWAEVLERKEKDPSSISVLDLFDCVTSLFGIQARKQVDDLLRQTRSYGDFVAAVRRDFLIIRYEDFIDRELGELESFLGFGLTADRDVGPDLDRTNRSQSYDNWRRAFVDSDVAALKERFDPVLLRFGYHEWRLDSVDRLPSGEWSGYVRRLAAEGQRV